MERTQLFDLMASSSSTHKAASTRSWRRCQTPARTSTHCCDLPTRDQREAGPLDQVPAHHRKLRLAKDLEDFHSKAHPLPAAGQ